jgi:hypothetical protein
MNVSTPQPNKNSPSGKSYLLRALSLLAPFSLNAQVVNDGATKMLANVTNTITGNVTVGTNGSFTLLVLSDNSLPTKSNRQPRTARRPESRPSES